MEFDTQKITVWLETIGALSQPERALDDVYGSTDYLRKRLLDGVALCRLLNYVRPDTLNQISLASDNLFVSHDNINRFLTGCEFYLGLDSSDLFEIEDLTGNGSFDKVLKVIVTLAKMASSVGKNPRLDDIDNDTIKAATPDIKTSLLLNAEIEHEKFQETFSSSRMVALYSYEREKEDEISFEEGEVILVIRREEGGWWEGQKVSTGEIGWLPSNYVQSAPDVVQPVVAPRNSLQQKEQSFMARTLFLREFLKSELNFYESLHAFVDNVVEYLANEQSKLVFSSTDHMIVFGRIYDVLSFHQHFVQDFDTVLKEIFSKQIICKLFMDSLESFTETYSTYCEQYSKAVRAISKYKTDEKFSECLKVAYLTEPSISAGLQFENPPIVNIMTWLVKPTQRLPKYVKFLQDLKKITPLDHTDTKLLPQVEIEFSKALSKLLMIKRNSENREILGDLSGRIDGWEGPSLEHYGELIMDGCLKIVKGDLKGKERYFFLLQKMFVCLQKNPIIKEDAHTQDLVHYKLVESFLINKMTVSLRTLADNEEYVNAFQLNYNQDGKQKSLVLSASSQEIKLQWLHAIQEVIDQSRYGSFPSIPRELQNEISTLPQLIPNTIKRFLSMRLKGKSYKKVMKGSLDSIFEEVKKEKIPDPPIKKDQKTLISFLPLPGEKDGKSKLIRGKSFETNISEDAQKTSDNDINKPKQSLSLKMNLGRSKSMKAVIKKFTGEEKSKISMSATSSSPKLNKKELDRSKSFSEKINGIRRRVKSANSIKKPDLSKKEDNDSKVVIVSPDNETFATESSQVPELQQVSPVDISSNVLENSLKSKSLDGNNRTSKRQSEIHVTFVTKETLVSKKDKSTSTYERPLSPVSETVSSISYPVPSNLSQENIVSASISTLAEQNVADLSPSLTKLINDLRANLEEYSFDLDLTKDLSTRQLQTLLMFSLQKHFESLDRISKLEMEIDILKRK